MEDHQEDATSELATAKWLHEWARRLPQPAKDKELPAERKRLELAEGEDKKRKPPAERPQSDLSRVDHRQRQAQAARDALAEAEQAIDALKAECTHQEALLAKDQEELHVAQSLHQAWGPSAREGEQASQRGKQPQDTEAMAVKTERRRDLLNRTAPDLLKELAGSLGIAATPQPAQEQQAAPPTPEAEGVEASGPKKTPSRSGSSRRVPTPAPGRGPQGRGPEATAHRGPRRREQPKGRQTTAPRRQKPSSCEEGLEAQAFPLGDHPKPHRGPIGMGHLGRAFSPLAGATSSHWPAIHGTQARIGFQGNAADRRRLIFCAFWEHTGNFWAALGPKGLAGGRHAIPPLTRRARGPHSGQPRARFSAPQIKHKKNQLMSWMGIPHAGLRDAVLAHGKKGRTRNGQGRMTPRGIPKSQPRGAGDPDRGPIWTVARATYGLRDVDRRGTTDVQAQERRYGHAATLPQHGHAATLPQHFATLPQDGQGGFSPRNP